MNSLTVDAGNTSIKVGIFNGSELKQQVKLNSLESLNEFSKSCEYEDIVVSSVSYPKKSFQDILGNSILFLDSYTPIPIKNHYRSKNTLGSDRLALMVGASFNWPHKNLIIIDLGTAITFDSIDKEGNYYGGLISPGIELRLKSLFHFTKNLPRVNLKKPLQFIGSTTAESIESGVYYGVLGEIKNNILLFREKLKSPQIVLSGGDAYFFESMIKEAIFAGSDLSLIGLNRILLYNDEV